MSVTPLATPRSSPLPSSLAAALQAAGVQLFELDIDTGALAWPGCAAGAVLGHPADELSTLDAWLALVHAQDRVALRNLLLGEPVAAESAAPALCIRLADAAGELHWVELRTAQLPGAARGRRVGTLLDITARRQSEQGLALGARILGSLRDAVVVTDRRGHIRWANAAFRALLGRHCAELIGCDLERFSGASEARRIEQRQALRDTLARHGAWRGQLELRHADGSVRILEACVSIAEHGPSEHGQEALQVHLCRDVTERIGLDEAALAASRAEQQQLGVALHDSLGQELAGTSMLVRTLRNAVGAGAGADPLLLGEVEALLQSSVSHCRSLAQAVPPFVIDEDGLGAALQSLVRRVRTAGCGASIRVEVCARTARLDGNLGHHLYGVAQLALAIALTRTAVSSVDLQLWWEEDDRIVLAIVADGHARARRNQAPAHRGDASAELGDSPDERLLRHRLERLGGSCEPLQASGGRSGLIAMVPVSAAGSGARPSPDVDAVRCAISA